VRRLASWIVVAAVTVVAAPGPGASAGDETKPAAAPAEPPAIAIAWLEGEGPARDVVVAIHRAAGLAPVTFHVAFATATARAPGDYGTIGPDAWRAVEVAGGEALLARRRIGTSPPTAVVVAQSAAKHAFDVHEMIDEAPPEGTVLFAHPAERGTARVDRHLARIGEKVTLSIEAPEDRGFFGDATFEIARIARRLGVGSDDPAGPRGYVGVDWRPSPEGGVAHLTGDAGAKRIRAQFDDSQCAWSKRHVGWMEDAWILEYERPSRIELTLDTSTVKSAGRVCDIWEAYGAVCFESIHRNGIGGTSRNLDLPPVLVVPKDVRVRDTTLR
jgi:hypothetical protein